MLPLAVVLFFWLPSSLAQKALCHWTLNGDYRDRFQVCPDLVPSAQFNFTSSGVTVFAGQALLIPYSSIPGYISGNWTWESYFRPQTQTGNYFRIFSGGNGIYEYLTGSGWGYCCFQQTWQGSSLVLGTDYHLVITRNSATQMMLAYLNGMSLGPAYDDHRGDFVNFDQHSATSLVHFLNFYGHPLTPAQAMALSVTEAPTPAPTTRVPTLRPTLKPTLMPTLTPSLTPTLTPTLRPTLTPTLTPTLKPTLRPTLRPTLMPTLTPTLTPSLTPTLTPTFKPTPRPTTLNPVLTLASDLPLNPETDYGVVIGIPIASVAVCLCFLLGFYVSRKKRKAQEGNPPTELAKTTSV